MVSCIANIGRRNRASVNVVISRISNAVTVTRQVAGVVSGISDRVRAVVKGVSGQSREARVIKAVTNIGLVFMANFST